MALKLVFDQNNKWGIFTENNDLVTEDFKVVGGGAGTVLCNVTVAVAVPTGGLDPNQR